HPEEARSAVSKDARCARRVKLRSRHWRSLPASAKMRLSRGRLAAMNDDPAAPAAGFVLGQPLPPALLYRRCDPAELPFQLCSELEAAPGLIGQDRAVEALDFAVRIRAKGYNVYALGASGTGRPGMVEDLLRQRAATEPPPPGG